MLETLSSLPPDALGFVLLVVVVLALGLYPRRIPGLDELLGRRRREAAVAGGLTVRRNRRQPAPGQLALPLVDSPPDLEGRTERPPLPRGWAPEGPVIVDVEARRRAAGGPALGARAAACPSASDHS